MANYYATARSNNFAVNNKGKTVQMDLSSISQHAKQLGTTLTQAEY